jgi:uncharacterized protein
MAESTGGSQTERGTAVADWVDVHVHVFPPEMVEDREAFLGYDARFAALYSSPRARMVTAEEVVAHMDEAGVGRSIVFGFAFQDQGLCRMANDYVLAAVAAYPERLSGLACVAPRAPGARRELERCLEAGMLGCGELTPGGTEEDLASLADTAAVLRERNLPLMVHANEPVGHDYPGKSGFGPAECVAVAGAYPGLKIVFAHLGGGTFLYETMPELREVLADAYYDTSAVPYLYEGAIYEAAIASAGAYKLIFGSDYPLLSPARYREGLGRLSPDALAAVCGGNARKVFGL